MIAALAVFTIILFYSNASFSETCSPVEPSAGRVSAKGETFEESGPGEGKALDEPGRPPVCEGSEGTGQYEEALPESAVERETIAGGVQKEGSPQEEESGVKAVKREKGAVPAPRFIEPLYVRPLTKSKSGSNDSNPVWSPSGDLLAFERSSGGKKEIIISNLFGSVMEKVYYRSSDEEGGMDFFFSGVLEEMSYNSGISWSPGGDRFAFMSNGGNGNYDLYLRNMGNETINRLTEDEGKDGHVQWSPLGDTLVFVSSRSGKAEVYFRSLVKTETRKVTSGEKSYLYPRWSPDGKKLAMIYGSNENHDISVIHNVKIPRKSVGFLTTWKYDDLRPSWSPDGEKIAFYSNYNDKDDPKVWALVVVSSDGSDPAGGEGLAAKVVAKNVIPDVETGPAWMPDGKRIVYVKNDEKAFNPIYIVDIEKKSEVHLKTGTKMNHDVTSSVAGIIAFRAQVEQWDHIFIAELKKAVPLVDSKEEKETGSDKFNEKADDL